MSESSHEPEAYTKAMQNYEALAAQLIRRLLRRLEEKEAYDCDCNDGQQTEQKEEAWSIITLGEA